MTEEAKAERRKYIRAWQKNHPERVKEYNERYWEKRAKNNNSGQ